MKFRDLRISSTPGALLQPLESPSLSLLGVPWKRRSLARPHDSLPCLPFLRNPETLASRLLPEYVSSPCVHSHHPVLGGGGFNISHHTWGGLEASLGRQALSCKSSPMLCPNWVASCKVEDKGATVWGSWCLSPVSVACLLPYVFFHL